MSVPESLSNDGYLDKEWVDLITYALNVGIPAEEIREFLEKSSTLKKFNVG
ncbi:anti-repressor SinI family protein [Metabacillus malikii]|uniref:DNA-binding transcriptional MerR regulator n=1 Tax=Metabacillus malikii TaxID=1504265 RepID=A0ABT9ZQC4_9BACI|nr:anti-repressor SinI family protein [Metabacillus malikii]MDQ0233435.1 DNA-binding transcriptional MerR regulator [Metabacillus malikii]